MTMSSFLFFLGYVAFGFADVLLASATRDAETKLRENTALSAGGLRFSCHRHPTRPICSQTDSAVEPSAEQKQAKIVFLPLSADTFNLPPT